LKEITLFIDIKDIPIRSCTEIVYQLACSRFCRMWYLY